MNRIIAIIVACIAVIAAVAQEKADIEVSYNYRHFHRTGKEQNHQLVLLANMTESKFYSPETEYIDSLEYTPEGKEIYNQMKMAAFASGNIGSVPSRKIPMYILKSKKKGDTEVYDGNVAMMFYYSEPYVLQNWEIVDSAKTILGYECVMATCDYRGREWSAWFTTDIPVQDGPWKLSGLPGLILEASESTGQHHLTATGIQATQREMTPVLGKDHYEKTDRISMLKALRKFEENPETGLGVALGVKIAKNNDVKIDKRLDFLETDYR